MIQRIKDMVLEWRITVARVRLIESPTRANFERFRDLVLVRNASQVARMEKRAGL